MRIYVGVILLASITSVVLFHYASNAPKSALSLTVLLDQKNEQYERGFRFIQTPITDETVQDAVKQVQTKIKEAANVRDITDRELYIREFAAVLRVCNRRDIYQKNPAELNLSERAVARVVRTLGNLQAEETAELLTEFLLLPIDFEVSRLKDTLDRPTCWALFEIGDTALPFLHRKMLSDHQRIRKVAGASAFAILGPRWSEQFETWLIQATTAQQKERLADAKPEWLITVRVVKASDQSVEEYRRRLLEDGRRRLAGILDRPNMFEQVERSAQELSEKQKLEQTSKNP